MLACRTDLILYKQVLFASEKKEYITQKNSQEYEQFETFFFIYFLSRVKFC